MNPRHWRLTALVAGATAVLVMVLSTVVWVVMERGKEDPGAAGTLDRLEQASDVGLWVPAGGAALAEDVTVTETATVPVSGFDSVDGIEPGTRSWLVQVTARAGQPTRLWLSGDEASSDDEPLFTVPQGSATVTTLVDIGDDGTLSLASDAEAQVDLIAVAAFTGTGESTPGPGGTEAVSPALALRRGGDLGAVPTRQAPDWVSPAGLGDVPSERVGGGWLRISATGSGEVLIGARDAMAPVLRLDGGSGSALVPAGVDADGRIWVATEGSVTSLRIDVVGWTATADPTTDAAVVEGGLVLSQPSTDPDGWPQAPAVTPTGAVSLWTFDVDQDGTVAGAGELSGRPVGTVATGSAGQVLTASTDGGQGAVASGTWWGYFAGPIDEPVRDQLRVGIETPNDGARIDLAASGAQLEFAGAITGAEGVRSVVLKRGDRYLGTATVYADADGHRWRYRTPATPGDHTITVLVEDYSGRTTSREVSFEAVAPASQATPVIAPRTVVGGTDFGEAITAATENTITLAVPSDLRVGDHLVAEPAEQLPDGRMAKVTGIRQEGAGMVIHTRPARLDEIFLQVEFVQTGLEVAESAPGVPGSYRVGEPGAPVVGSDGPGVEGVAHPRPGEIADVIRLVDFDTSWQVASLDIVGTFQGQASYADSQRGRTVKANSETTVQVDVSGQRVIDESYPHAWEKELSGTTTVSASASFEAKVQVHASTSVNLVLDTEIDWNWFRTTVVVNEFKLSQTQHFNESLTFNATGEFQQGMDRDAFQAEPAGRAKTLKDAAREAAKAKDTRDPQAKSLEERLTTKLGTVKFTIAAVPVWINIYASINAGYGAFMTGEMSGSQSFGFVQETGVRYRGGRWSVVNEFQLTAEAQEARFSVDAMVSIIPFVTFKAMVYDVAGPTIDLSLMLELTAHAEGEAHRDGTTQGESAGARVAAEVSLDLYGFGSVGARIDLFSFDEEWHSGELELFRHNIWRRHWEACAGDACAEDEDATIPASDGDTSALGRGDRPLVLLMDTSSSMAGQRIESAKASLRGVLQAQELGSEIGLYTYPGGNPTSTGDCTTGQFVIPVEPIAGFSNLLTAIDQVQTQGDTPTGEALLAVAATLEARGRTGATILLVSDGETTCGVPPCEVAAQLADRGFEITIPTVAFNTSAAGAAELACIAEATGAKALVIESDDPDELWETVEELSLADLEVGLAHPDTVASNGAATVEITVANPSARDVRAVRVSVTSDGLGSQVTPATEVVVGNIPAGGTVTRTMRVTTAGDGTGEVSLRVLAWGRNVEAHTAESTYRVVEPGQVTTEPGEILEPGRDAEMIALGDGFASGTECADDLGATPLGVVTEGSGTSVACPGATVRDILDPIDGVAQIDQLPEPDGTPRVVQLSVGAEDVSLPLLLRQCAAEECPADDPRITNAIRVAQELDLPTLYSEVAERLSADGEAVLVVTPYPYLFDVSTGRACSAEFSRLEARALNAVVGTLNRAAEAGVAEAVARGHEVYFASGVADALLPDASLCSDQPGVEFADGLALTAEGAVRSGEAMARWSQGRARADLGTRRGEPSVATDGHLLSWMFPGRVDVRMDAQRPGALLDVRIPAEGRSTVVKGGQALRVHGTGYAPGSTVTLSLMQERPVALGTFPVAPDGSFEAITRVPHGTPVGEGTLALLGITAGGQAERVLTPVQVAAPVSLGVSIWLPVSLLAGLGALLVFGLAFRLRRRLAVLA